MTITDLPGGIGDHGIEPSGRVFRNPTTSQLYTHALARKEAVLAEDGPLVVDTGRFTGRSPKDKFVVREPGSEERIWWGDVNAELSEPHFEGLRGKLVAHLQARDLYVIDAFAGADPAHRIGVRVITAHPYHALFSKTMFIEPSPDELAAFSPDVLVLHEPEVEADPATDGTRSGTFVALHPARGEILIGGTFYAGEIKKSVFTVMNDLLPLEGVLPMHCSANVSRDGENVAVFFGLSGTGKTTLSADPERLLIGDDEHGWGDDGVFNFEGGCYAKTIRLSLEAEPEIWKAAHSFGTVLENVVVDEEGRLDLDDDAKTENTRAAYRLEEIANALPTKRAGHPDSVIFLAADAFGVLPPIARLDRDQALFYFLSGYTSKLAGTELGVTEPQPTFSTCFAAPFLPQPPTVYARLLGRKLDEHGASVWLINTGWTGGPFGEGHRMPIQATRALLHAVLSGALHEVEFRRDPVFGFEVPLRAPGVDESLLDPRSTWADPDAYDRKARELADRFRENFAQHEDAAAEIVAAGPQA
ncbi:MAG TPA: phosphoenolpyruvate carboxykinase (ATP) [Gaiellaceae bacterium]|nr:phosphoenolpyruvate carboxykinase (ATP) [Gaiellaceae bacterium]